MKMKKIVTLAAFVALAISLNAQSLDVSSAYQYMNKKPPLLKKAKECIDRATLDEKAREDSRTWCYRAIIYTMIGAESNNPKSKYKDLDKDWADKAYEAAMECKRLDTKHEWDVQLKDAFGNVGIEYYNRSGNLYNEKKFAEAMQFAVKAIDMFNNGGNGEYSSMATYRAGVIAMANRDTTNIKKYFNNLMAKKTNNDQVYTVLFNIYKAEKNNDRAMRVATTFQKNCPNDYHAYLMLAEGYLMNNNMELGTQQINKALELTKDSANIYPTLLAQSAALLEITGDFAGAEAKYQESLQLNPVQFEANYNIGRMYYNRAVDKVNSAPEPDPFDENSMALYDKLMEESKDLYRQSITYFVKAVEFLDALPEAEKPYHRHNLGEALEGLANAYARVEMYTESTAAKNRLKELTTE